MARGIYKFHVDCGRANYLDGKFTAEPEDIAFAVNATVYFEEPFGRHTGVEITFAPEHFELVSADPADVATFERLDAASGHCPLGLLADSISDGRVEVDDEDAASAPPYFQKAIAQNAERLRWIEEHKQRRG